jgi:hypothetical protein
MDHDDILCEAAGPGGRTCTLPYGHKPENTHMFEIELPADLGNLMDRMMENAEKAKEYHLKEAKKARLWRWLFMGSFVLYIGLALWKWLG